jgi:hypothetical protein
MSACMSSYLRHAFLFVCQSAWYLLNYMMSAIYDLSYLFYLWLSAYDIWLNLYDMSNNLHEVYLYDVCLTARSAFFYDVMGGDTCLLLSLLPVF